MIRTYVLYLITGLITFWTVLFLLGVSAGFASYAPIAALFGSILLFSAASPLLVVKKRLGLTVGLVGLVLLFPFDIGFTLGIFDDGFFNWEAVLGFVPILLALLTLFYTVKEFKINTPEAPSNKIIRILMIVLPVLLSVLYAALYGRYWTWQMFNV